MKTSVLFAAFSIIALSVFLVCARFDVFNHGTSVSMVEDNDGYTFSARYNSGSSNEVWHYVNAGISPVRLGNSGNDYVDVKTFLPDKTTFYIKESPGRLKIKLNKRENSTASYNRIKKMCGGIKQLLTGK